MSQASSFPWFARHELSLSWRDLYAMLSANRPGRGSRIMLLLATLVAALHFLAYGVLTPVVHNGIKIDQSTIVIISGFLLLPISLMTSQAMESITRAFYTRSDLELILSSPAPARKLFAIRMTAIGFATTTLTLAICAPVLNILAWLDQPGWIFGYLVIIGFGLLATSLGIVLTMGMFTILGPRKTRIVAQIIAAIVGASFVIGVQLLAIASIGSISRLELFKSDTFAAMMPGPDSWLWLPAHAATGDVRSLVLFAIISLGIFALTLLIYAGKFGAAVLNAGSVDFSQVNRTKKPVSFRFVSTNSALRHKEWKTLLRDKWLLSQTLMQLFYLIPPGFMLWQGFGKGGSPEIIAVPVLVMAAGQFAGGLAWLAISGEDAPDLVATAPVARNMVIRAKVEAVLTAVAILVSPIVLLVFWLSPQAALIAIFCVALSTISATYIQLWFRTQAKRSNFRRRQTSSRVATFGEAFSSIIWAGTAGIWIAGSWLAIPVALFNLAILAFVWWISPARHDT